MSALLPAPQASVSGAVSPNLKARPLGIQCRACFCLFPCLRTRSQTGSSRLAEPCPSSLHLSRAGPLFSPFPFLGSTLTFREALGRGASPSQKHEGRPGGHPTGEEDIHGRQPRLPSSSFMSVAQSCPTLYGPMDCSPPGSSVHGILQARKLEWVVIPFSRVSF